MQPLAFQSPLFKDEYTNCKSCDVEFFETSENKNTIYNGMCQYCKVISISAELHLEKISRSGFPDETDNY